MDMEGWMRAQHEGDVEVVAPWTLAWWQVGS